MSRFRRVAAVDQIPKDEGLVVDVDGREIAIFRCAGQFYAVENTCPHQGGPVAEGEFEDGVVNCPWHAWPFDVRTGECTINSSAKLETFEVRVRKKQVFLAVSLSSGA